MDTLTNESEAEPSKKSGKYRGLSKYQEIAGDIASKIATGELQQDSVIYAKSTVASQYAVSSETARRALVVLRDYGIVELIKGSGVRIISRKKAVEYIRRYGDITTFSQLRNELEKEITVMMDSRGKIDDILMRLKEKAQYFRAANPFIPYEVPVLKGCCQIGKTLLETHFWNMTSATVVAIRRQNDLMFSPGPAVCIEENDVLYYICAADCVEKVEMFLAPGAAAVSAGAF